MDWLFSNLVKREKQRAAMYAKQTLATWERHRCGDPPEEPVQMVEAARCVVDHYGDRAPVHLTRIARAVLDEVER